ncbi:hypothetical protein L5515_000139 [Caenorhabditis briggsae]|uniref:Protein kinase domain-containing protein n=1 Tax=Caenorhabditis briggsae TaxID=6238 RepID=A0AAE9DYP2_CAEBR|nr:hypothetical protein L5515_000139 [Caenorhabditis briggsae]
MLLDPSNPGSPSGSGRDYPGSSYASRSFERTISTPKIASILARLRNETIIQCSKSYATYYTSTTSRLVCPGAYMCNAPRNYTCIKSKTNFKLLKYTTNFYQLESKGFESTKELQMAAAAAAAPQKELIRAQNGVYEVTKPLATGTFGSIYKAKRESDGKLFAVKCESLNMKSSLLRQMSVVLASIHYPSPFFATIEERGTVPQRFLFVVMPLYGDNLFDLMHNVNKDRKFSIATGLHLAEQTLTAIRDLHRNGFIHRDIKPSHFCIGRETEDQYHHVFLLDFGLCKRPRLELQYPFLGYSIPGSI